MGRKKRVRPKVGDVFALPLTDGSFGVAHLVRDEPSAPTFLLFGARFETAEAVAKNLEEAVSQPIAALRLIGDGAEDGSWPLVAHREPDAAFAIPGSSHSYSDNFGPELVSSYTGVARPFTHPDYFRRYLLPGIPLPPCSKGPPPGGSQPAPSIARVAEPPVAPDGSPPRGPARARIVLPYPGADLPSVDAVRRRQALARAIESGMIGKVSDAGGGGGRLEIFLELRHAAAVHDRILELARAYGFTEVHIEYRRERTR